MVRIKHTQELNLGTNSEHIRDMSHDLGKASESQRQFHRIFSSVLRIAFGGMFCEGIIDRIQAIEPAHGAGETGPIAELITFPFAIATNSEDECTILVHFTVCQLRNESDDNTTSVTIAFSRSDEIVEEPFHIDECTNALYSVLHSATEEHPHQPEAHAKIAKWIAGRMKKSLAAFRDQEASR